MTPPIDNGPRLPIDEGSPATSARERLAAALLESSEKLDDWLHLMPGEDATTCVVHILAVDPHLAQDIEDGAALRRLREALGEEWGGPNVDGSFGGGWRVQVWTGRGAGAVITEKRSTIAEAADACREALEATR